MSRAPLSAPPSIEVFVKDADAFSAGCYFAALRSDPNSLRVVEVTEHGTEHHVSYRVWAIGTERHSSVEDWDFKYRVSNVGKMKLWTVIHVRVDEDGDLSTNENSILGIQHSLVRASSSEEALKVWQRNYCYYCFGVVVEGDIFPEFSNASPPLKFEQLNVQEDK